VTLENILAVPVYHKDYRNAPQPPPWAAIGTVCFSSTAPDTQVAGMCNARPDVDSDKLMKEARDLSQIFTDAIVGALRGG